MEIQREKTEGVTEGRDRRRNGEKRDKWKGTERKDRGRESRCERHRA
jgi:hypothetical protein